MIHPVNPGIPPESGQPRHARNPVLETVTETVTETVIEIVTETAEMETTNTTLREAVVVAVAAVAAGAEVRPVTEQAGRVTRLVVQNPEDRRSVQAPAMKASIADRPEANRAVDPFVAVVHPWDVAIRVATTISAETPR